MSNKLFVGGLAWATTDASLKEAFEPFGEVVDAKVILDRETGRSRGFGFVTFSDASSAKEAITAMDGAAIDGRNVRVNEAEERRGGGGGPRRGGGGGGDRRGGGYGGGGGGGYGGDRRGGGGGPPRERSYPPVERRGGGPSFGGPPPAGDPFAQDGGKPQGRKRHNGGGKRRKRRDDFDDRDWLAARCQRRRPRSTTWKSATSTPSRSSSPCTLEASQGTSWIAPVASSTKWWCGCVFGSKTCAPSVSA